MKFVLEIDCDGADPRADVCALLRDTVTLVERRTDGEGMLYAANPAPGLPARQIGTWRFVVPGLGMVMEED